MKNLSILILSLCLGLSASAQSPTYFGASLPGGTSAAKGPVFLPGPLTVQNLGTADTSKFLSVDANGRFVLRSVSKGGAGSVTSVGLAMPTAFSVTNSPVTGAGSITVSMPGLSSQYLRGNGTLAAFPTALSSFTNDVNYLTSVPAQSWTSITGKPTTLSGFGITDGATKTAVSDTAAAIRAAIANGFVTNNRLTDTATALRAAIAAGGGGLSTIYAVTSKSGVPDNAILGVGSSTYGTDGTAALQAIFDRNKFGGALVVSWDTHTSGTGLIIYPNTTIVAAPGCGFIQRPNAQIAMLRFAGETFATPINANINIEGGIWDQNSPAQTGNVGSGSYGQYSVFRFYGAVNLYFKNVEIIRQKCYAGDIINCRNVTWQGCRVNGDIGSLYNDGIHANACYNFVIRDSYIKAHDDAIAINCDDQYNNPGGQTYPYYLNAYGPGFDGLVENTVLNSDKFGIRLLTGGSRLDRFITRGLGGSTKEYAIVIDNYWQGAGLVSLAGPGNFGRITLEDIHVDVTGGTGFGNNSIINVNANVENLTIKGLRRNNHALAAPAVFITGAGTKVRSLKLSDYSGYDNVNTTAMPIVWVQEATVTSLVTSDIVFDKTSGFSESPLLKITGGGKVDLWQATNVTMNGAYHMLDNASGTIQRISATNIMHINSGLGATFKTNSAVPRITLSTYTGNAILDGVFTVRRGDAFTSDSTGGGVVTLTGYGPQGGGNASVGTPLTFTTSNTGVTNTAGVWNTTSNNGSWSGNGAMDALTLAPNTAGRLIQYCDAQLGPANGTGVIGFRNSSGIPANNFDYHAGFSMGGSPNITIIQDSNPSVSNVAWVVGHWYAVYRSAGGVFSIQESEDGANWSDIIPLSAAPVSTTLKYIDMSLYGNGVANHVFYPKSNGAN
jgi:hypothetical protein